jgi:hypothetical protein
MLVMARLGLFNILVKVGAGKMPEELAHNQNLLIPEVTSTGVP